MWNPKNDSCENMAATLPFSLHRGLGCSRNLPQTCAEVSAALNVSCRPAQTSQQLRTLTILIVKLVASRMLFHSMTADCTGPGGHGSIWKYIPALAQAIRGSERNACWFRTDLYFADVVTSAEVQRACKRYGTKSMQRKKEW